MITTDGSDRFDLTVYVHEFTADSLQIDKREGIDNISLLLSGKIDDPDVSPMGDIREFLPGSRFSEQSCEIRLMKQNLHQKPYTQFLKYIYQWA